MQTGLPSHSDLMVSFFHYAARLLAQGDRASLKMMGVEADDVRAMEQLTVTQLHRLGELSAHFIDFRVSRPCLRRVLKRLANEQAETALQDRLLRAGAALPLMNHYFGFNSADCTSRRQVLRVAAQAGRPRVLTDEEFDELVKAWRATEELTDERERLLALHERTGLSLEVIWPVVQEWQAELGTP